MRIDRVEQWVQLVEQLWPERDAESWDAVGLQVGDPADPVRAVLVCLDVTDAALDEAAGRGADLLLAHHPLLFRPLARLTTATPPGRLALRAARERVAVLAAHSNLDVAVPGTSDPVARILGLHDVRPLRPLRPAGGGLDPEQVKLVTFVPVEHTLAVIAAAAAAGAGHIGGYDECSFRVTGTGTFRPGPGTSPAVGERGRRTEVTEDRLEVVVPRAGLAAVVEAVRAAHPYEEVAWDAYPLVPPPPAGRARGLGLVGVLPQRRKLVDIADALAVELPSPHLRVVGDLDRAVTRVAACGGAGDALIGDAVAAGVDLYVTGDLRHHPALDAAASGLALIDAGHAATEAAALPVVVEALGAAARERGLSARLLASDVVTAPWAAYGPPTSGRPIVQTGGDAG